MKNCKKKFQFVYFADSEIYLNTTFAEAREQYLRCETCNIKMVQELLTKMIDSVVDNKDDRIVHQDAMPIQQSYVKDDFATSLEEENYTISEQFLNDGKDEETILEDKPLQIEDQQSVDEGKIIDREKNTNDESLLEVLLSENEVKSEITQVKSYVSNNYTK